METTLRGPMQVELALAGQKITRVTVLQRTNDGPESQQIDGSALPRLVSETLAAQSGHVDAVSGATYTSEATSGPCRAPSTRPAASWSLRATLSTDSR